MNSKDERSNVSIDADRINIGGSRAQGNNVASGLNSTRTTIKIDSLSIKLGIVKEKNDAEQCRHFSIRGYVSGMRERGNSNCLPFTQELPHMEIPNFRYWKCQRCLQNNGTTNASHETPFVSVCGHCLVRPGAKSCSPQDPDAVAVPVLPFGEGTSGVKSVDGKDDDESESAVVAIGADKSQPSQEIPAKVKLSQEIPKLCSVDTNVAANSLKENNDLKAHEEQQKTSPVSQPNESGQQDDYPNGNPRRKARKVRLLKELLCGNTEIQQQKNEDSSVLASSSQVKRKIPPDHDHDHARDNDHEHGHDQRVIDGKKAKVSKVNAVPKNNVVEHSRESVAREIEETANKFQWNKHGTQRSSIPSKVGSDAMTAWRSIFSDMGKTDNQIKPTAYGVPKGRGTEPYSNFMAPPKPNKKIIASKKIPSSTPLKNNFFGEGSKRMKDRQSDTELGLGLSLSYDPQMNVRSQPSLLNRTPTQDHGRMPGFFLGESSSFAHRIPTDLKANEGSVFDVSNRHASRPAVVQEQRPYTQVPYGGCSGHQNQKLDFSDPHKRNSGVIGYSDVTRPHNHQRQENMFSVGRSDEREIIELMARNQYERSLCEGRTHFSPIVTNNNGLIPNATGFRKVNMNEGMSSSHRHEYLNVMRPMDENMAPPATMRNPGFTMFDGLKQPMSGVWISESGPQRHYDSRYHLPKGNNKMAAQTHIYNPTNMQVLEAFNKYNDGSRQNETVNNRMSFGQPYAKYTEKDKGKNMIDLDLNVEAPSVVEDYNTNLDSEEMRNPKRKCSLDSSYSNEAIPAMQLLSLMDAGKSSQPFNTNGQKFTTKPVSPCYSQCRSTVTERSSPMVNTHFTYSALRPGVQNPITSSFSSAFQNVKLTSSHGQQAYYKPQEEKSRGYRPEDSYSFPLPWHATEDRNKIMNGMSGPAVGPSSGSGTEICTINQNPADFSIPGPGNIYMIGAEDLKFNGERSYNGPKRQKILR